MKEFDRLIHLMKRLRSPLNGCPWDRRQTPESLAAHVIEEAHELAAAIHSGSIPSQLDELGDLLLQVVFLARIHQERGHFSIRDVVFRLRRKLIRRHPHIFGSARADTAEDVKMLWEQVKQREKGRVSVISEYPEAMPALAVSQRIGEQASSAGFDWRNLPEARGAENPSHAAVHLALDKVPEETRELEQAIRKADRESQLEEVGDLLFSIVNVARLLGVNAEEALRTANTKFTRRFRYMEERLREVGKTPDEVTLDELESLWRDSKSVTRHKG